MRVEPADLTATRVLVVAPHADDETLGCGGLLWHLARLGREVRVVFVTDGGASHAGSPSWPRARLAAEREREAEEALRRLGLGEAPRLFLRLPDAGMPEPGEPGHARALDALRAMVEDLEPDLAVLPWRRDPHRDHRDGFALAAAALGGLAAPPTVLEYAIWLDELGDPGDRPGPEEAEAVDVAIGLDALAAKRSALAAHRTQVSALIDDDPSGFRLGAETIARLTGPVERFWRVRP